MGKTLEVILRNGENIDYSFIEHSTKEAEKALSIFEEEIIQNGLKVELHIYRLDGNTVCREYRYIKNWPEDLLKNVDVALSSTLQ
ncbi:MAG: hypothetical protein IPJ02_02060 [Chitinophagaceae bacterium]|nr:hypothetical protein [Chitinophagaceae bacterium]